jgi:hypothetical protein
LQSHVTNFPVDVRVMFNDPNFPINEPPLPVPNL